MKQLIKGALIGAICGVAAPVGLAVANEVLFAHNKYNDVTAARICFAERTWSLFRLDIKYAKGCKNGLLDSVPLCLVIGVLGGSLIGALSLVSKNTGQKTPDQPAPPAVVPQEPLTASVTEQTPDPVETSHKDSPIPSLPSIDPQVSQGFQQLKEVNWVKAGAGAAVAAVVVIFGCSTLGGNKSDPNPLKHLQQSGFQVMGTDGYKWSFGKEGVTCITEETPPVTTEPNSNGWYTKTGSYVSVYCRGFGFNEDQTGKKFHYSTTNVLCQRTGHEYWESSDGNAPVSGTDGEYPTKTPVTTYRDPVTSNHVICQAGRHFNMF